MTRLASLALLLLALPAFASVALIAPIEARFGDLPYDDVAPRAASDGVSTLVVWDNAGPPFYNTGRPTAVFVQPDGTPAGPSFRIDTQAGSPLVTSNGDEYLVAYGRNFPHGAPYGVPDVFVRTVKRDGTVGESHAIHQSPAGAAVTALVWSGDHWIVAFYDGTPHVAFLDRGLQSFAPDVDLAGLPLQIIKTPDHVYAFQITGAAIKAFEISPSGQITEIGSQPYARNGSLFAVPTSSGALIAIAGLDATDVLTFSSTGAFSAPVQIGGGLRDLAPLGGDFIALRAGTRGATGPLTATTLTAAGAVAGTQTILPSAIDAHLVGSLLLVSVPESADARANGDAIVSFTMTKPEPLVEADGHVVSLTRTDLQSQPLIVSAGSYAVAFWNQTIDDKGTLRAFSRKFDASGRPLADPAELPFALGDHPRGAFDGTRFVLSWTSAIVTVSGDGTTATAPVTIFPPSDVKVGAAADARFAVWVANQVLRGTPVDASGNPLVPEGITVLPSIRPQADPDVAPFGSGFITVWTEDADTGAMVLSPQGTPSVVHTIGSGVHPVVAGDSESALAAWLTPAGATVFVPFDKGGGSFDLFDPHWGDHFALIRLAPSGNPSHYFAGLMKNGNLFVAGTGQQGGFMTELEPPRFVAPVSSDFSLAGVQGHPLAVWSADLRVWIGTPDDSRRHIANH